MRIEATKSMAELLIRNAIVSFIDYDGQFSEQKAFLSNLAIGYDPLGLSVEISSGNLRF